MKSKIKVLFFFKCEVGTRINNVKNNLTVYKNLDVQFFLIGLINYKKI